MKYINTANFLFFLLFPFLMNGQEMASDSVAYPEADDVFVSNEVTINTEQLEFSPTFFEDGILFISTNVAGKKFKVKDKRMDKNIMSIFISRRDKDGKLKKPEPFALELMTTVHEGPLTFDRTTEQMFFTRNNFKNNRIVKAKDGIVKLQIYGAVRQDNVWTNIEKLSFNDDNSNAAHPSISVENDQIYFASDRPGGFGGMDLYVSIKEGDSWGAPINLGPQINTENDEVFPFIHADGTLYFSSNGHGGVGSLDLFSATGSHDKWMTPQNMGKPFNSPQDDLGIIIDRDKKNGYFSSNRKGGLGDDDIYSFFALNGLDEEEEEVIPDFEKDVLVHVTDAQTGEVLESSNITYMKLDETTLGRAITDLSSAGTLNSDEDDLVLKLPINDNTQTGLSDNNGDYRMTLNRGNYVIKVQKDGYESKQIALNSEAEIEQVNVALVQAIEDELAGANGTDNGNSIEGGGLFPNGDGSGNGVSSTIQEGTIFELPNIYYNFNDASIRPDARIDLDALAEFLVKFPTVEIELSSHTDARGSDKYNTRLSQRRAENAVDYLIQRGIDKYRLVPRGYGESQLRNQCTDNANCSERDHQYNRRTEVRITKMEDPITVKFVNNPPEVISEAPFAGQDSSSGTRSTDSSNNSSPVIPEYAPEGKYKVVAGAFSNISNAKKRLAQVRDLGYNNADILQFEDQKLFFVVVSRYDSSSEAAVTVRELKRKNVRSFIKS